MGGRRRNHWKTLVPLGGETPACTKGPFVLAPVSSVADIIEMCATVSFINGIESSNDDNPGGARLRAHRVYTARPEGMWKSQTFVAFRTRVGTLPAPLNTYCTYKACGSEYELIIANSIPVDCHNILDVSHNGLARDTECLCKAVSASAMTINECIDPNSEFFKDAVSSRLRFFVRQRMTSHRPREYFVNYQSPVPSKPVHTHPPLPPGPPPIPPGPRPMPPNTPKNSVYAFKRPHFDNVDDLLFAFATHTIDPNTGVVRLLSPRENHPTDRSQCQPLIFCSPVCRDDICTEEEDYDAEYIWV